MNSSRRNFLAAGAAAAAAVMGGSTARGAQEKRPTKADLEKILNQPVLNTESLKGPVIVASVELLKSGRNYLLRTRSVDGAEAITAPNP
ncbi:MAG: mandelate racemase/muconate lactonizing enzyme family protein, partial [Planctomycetia bacterium]|nr:mandelate racemase/muconate lactonizing enzyme family protein [Planctomycetia bacterium]